MANVSKQIILYAEPPQIERIKQAAMTSKITIAEFVRRAVTQKVLDTLGEEQP